MNKRQYSHRPRVCLSCAVGLATASTLRCCSAFVTAPLKYLCATPAASGGCSIASLSKRRSCNRDLRSIHSRVRQSVTASPVPGIQLLAADTVGAEGSDADAAKAVIGESNPVKVALTTTSPTPTSTITSSSVIDEDCFLSADGAEYCVVEPATPTRAAWSATPASIFGVISSSPEGLGDVVSAADENEEAGSSAIALYTMMGLCFLIAIVCALDRVAMSVAIVSMTKVYGYSDTTKGLISSVFSWGYMASMIPSSVMIGVWGPKASMATGVVVWSVAQMLSPAAAAGSLTNLLACRFAMGVGEAVTVPCIQAIVAEWVPQDQRSRWLSLIISGLQIGTVLAYLASPAIISAWNWERVFITYGALGLAWLVLWLPLISDRPPDILVTAAAAATAENLLTAPTVPSSPSQQQRSDTYNDDDLQRVAAPSFTGGQQQQETRSTAILNSAPLTTITTTTTTTTITTRRSVNNNWSTGADRPGSGATVEAMGSGSEGAAAVAGILSPARVLLPVEDDSDNNMYYSVSVDAANKKRRVGETSPFPAEMVVLASGATAAVAATAIAAPVGGVGVQEGVLVSRQAMDTMEVGGREEEEEEEEEERKVGAGAGEGGGVLGGFRDVPWREYATNGQIWSISSAHMAHNWGLYVMLAWLPTYFNQEFHLSLGQSSGASVIPWVAGAVTGNLAGWSADALVNKGTLELQTVRKLFQTIALVGPAVCMLALAQGPETSEAASLLFTVAVALGSCSCAGFGSSVQDLKSRHTGVIYGLTSACAAVVGSAGTFLTGVVLDTTDSWVLVFQATAAVYLIGAVLYGSGYRAEPLVLQNKEA